MKIGNILDQVVERSVADKVGRCDNRRVKSDVGAKYGIFMVKYLNKDL